SHKPARQLAPWGQLPATTCARPPGYSHGADPRAAGRAQPWKRIAQQRESPPPRAGQAGKVRTCLHSAAASEQILSPSRRPSEMDAPAAPVATTVASQMQL